MITVDYYSYYFEIDRLYCTTTSAIVKNLKNQFARHGIPDKIMTDNGPNLVSDKFVKFAESWNFLHTSSSSYYSHSNGKAETAIKIAKTLLRKVKRSKLNFYEALLVWGNTPTEGVNASPSQRLFLRRIKTKLPTTEKTCVWICYEKEIISKVLSWWKLKKLTSVRTRVTRLCAIPTRWERNTLGSRNS